MALKKCLYCYNLISDRVTLCPKCHAKSPFDLKIKEKIDKDKERSKEIKKIYDSKRECLECGVPLELYPFFLSRRPCPECGYNQNVIKCHYCSDNATNFDTDQNQFICRQHLVEECCMVNCSNIISGNEKHIIVSGSWHSGYRYDPHCKSCYKKKYPDPPKKIGCWVLLVFVGLMLVLQLINYFLL